MDTTRQPTIASHARVRAGAHRRASDEPRPRSTPRTLGARGTLGALDIGGTLGVGGTRPTLGVRGTRGALAALGALVLATAALSGCSYGVRSCPSWADFSDPDAAYRQADVVAVGHATGRDGTIATGLGDVRAYRFEVDEVVKGGASGATMRIGSRADPCDGGDGYVAGDALATTERVIVYAMRDTGGLVTLTPTQGVTPFPGPTAIPGPTGGRTG